MKGYRGLGMGFGRGTEGVVVVLHEGLQGGKNEG